MQLNNMSFRFTVFTATFNRAHTLPRLYDSLKQQAFKDFEWLIVDDGSSDGTRDLISQWQAEGRIPIRYFFQENSGKHIAINRGVTEAKSELFLFTDSDDWLVPHALERLIFHWDGIEEAQRKSVSGITFLCRYESGKVVGSRFHRNAIIDDPVSFHITHRVHGDKKGFHRTEILKRYPFPDFPGEKFVPEGLVWNRIASDYQVCFVNEALEVIEYQEDGLSAAGTSLRARNPTGVRTYNLEFARRAIPLRYRAKAFINFFRFSAHGRVPVQVAFRDLGQFFPGLVFLPVGYLLYASDRFRLP